MSTPTRKPQSPRARAAKTAAENRRIITRQQALDAGLTPRQVEGLLATGEWSQMHRGVYLVGDAPPDWETRCVAAVRAAERCPNTGRKRVVAVSHRAALVCHGLRGPETALPEITVVGDNRPRLSGVKVHRACVLEECDVQVVEGIPVTTGARMLCDLAGVLPEAKFVALLDDTICARVARRKQVCERARQLRPGRPPLARLIALTEPGAEGTFRSYLERTSAQAVAAAGLPPPRWNVAVHDELGKIGVVDAIWDGIPLIVEFEGLRFHSQPAERQRDAERFNRLTDIARVRRFTYRDVMERPEYVIASLREALDAGPARGAGSTEE
ncbi:MAG: type IV toxin-antitoxin system AbiEi family antitoxin domain-containing protein [Egibacteraceae bacterium]